ncbi:hypothetical protein GUJ93_ZPchr0005g15481 [Zizania palustris]|uniref:Myb-like domain-containing protein n=1 Tax=Zizania palustris TaxID=103762 RepID=A0A8J5VRW3_ZIZPA|nr:hypothetical protein GUJ93_ZPchr0005g15481 [Zizania palustris]
MSAVSRSSSPNSNSKWSLKENKMFEEALAYYGEGTPNLWDKVSSAMGGSKSTEEVRCHYEDLVDDIKLIESRRVPYPNTTPKQMSFVGQLNFRRLLEADGS